jgi:regulator of RNase E activity RraA|tara:strand:+ start:518 stop:1291 length:774 start_codon:yes stop_codon:yes gene_type:complete
MTQKKFTPRLPHEELLQLKRWNTPTIYNGWEQITKHDPARAAINHEVTTDFMPQMGPMVGWAITVKIEPSNPDNKIDAAKTWSDYRSYVADISGPKIVVIQDIDKPATVGSFWGEVSANTHRALGCVGTITDGAVRDLDEMTNAGFKALAKRLCVGHAHVVPIDWGCEIEVFGQSVLPGQLIHADKHGFLAVPFGEEEGLLDASVFMDKNECDTVIKIARSSAGVSSGELLDGVNQAVEDFSEAAKGRFGNSGEFGD